MPHCAGRCVHQPLSRTFPHATCHTIKGADLRVASNFVVDDQLDKITQSNAATVEMIAAIDAKNEFKPIKLANSHLVPQRNFMSPRQ